MKILRLTNSEYKILLNCISDAIHDNEKDQRHANGAFRKTLQQEEMEMRALLVRIKAAVTTEA